ncbi:MAG: hypothetical protein ACKVW3_00725 [Phycisphaerales bacterium]
MPAWSPAERRALARLRSPHDIQALIDTLDYSCDDFYRSPRRVLIDRRAHCVDGALLAAAALRRQGHPPRIVWLHAVNDDGHLLAVFQQRSLWGAIAKSNFVGIRFREPVYRSLRELVMSYFNDYFNSQGQRTMRAYARALNLARFDHLDWETRDDVLPPIVEDALDALTLIPIAPPAALRALRPMDDRSLAAGMLGVSAKGLFKPS